MDEIYAAQLKHGYGDYYRKLLSAGGVKLTQIEKENPDLSKPFSLYSGRIRLTVHERLNVLERETVKAYLKREETNFQ